MTTGGSTELARFHVASGGRQTPWQASSGESGTLWLTVLAAIALTAARAASTQSAWSLVLPNVLAVAGPLAVLGVQRWRRASQSRWDRWLGAAVSVWCLLPLAAELLRRRWGTGEGNELVMLACLQNAALMLSAYSHCPRCQQVSCLLSASLVLFAVVIESNAVVWGAAALYGVALLWWLIARYWERVQRARSPIHVTRCLPARWSALGVAALFGVLSAAAFGAGGGATYVLRGFLPTSGGDRWSDPFARAGVRDGDAVVAAKDDAMSFGPVESELFLESCMPTLYDMFNDLYGEPLKRKEKQERAVSLPPENVRRMEQRIAQTQRGGREFSVLRRRTQTRQEVLDDRRAPAMLYVVGPVPVHLALESFDTFDGATWSQMSASPGDGTVRQQQEAGRTWFYFGQSSPWNIARRPLQHGAKIINLKTNRVPTPPQFDAVHVDRMEQSDFWGWTDDGMPAMVAREHIPQLTVLHLRSQQVDLQVLREQDFTALPTSGPEAAGAERRRETIATNAPQIHLQTPATSSAAVAELARRWTDRVPRGWQQVEAVIERLREDYHLDPDLKTDPHSGDVLGQFLRQQGGPEYCFATAAAIALRHLGYPTRLVAGFYARPERFDRVAGQTAVLAQDAHVWAEVRIDDHTWLTIEPSPGYAAPREAQTWRRRAATLVRSGLDWLLRHPLGTILGAALLAAIWLTRWRWLDAAARVVWNLGGLGNSERRLRATVRLLEWRCRRCGRIRPAHVTLSQWYGELAAVLPDESARAVVQFLRRAERALYGSPRDGMPGQPCRELHQACRCVANGLTIQTIRKAAVGV